MPCSSNCHMGRGLARPWPCPCPGVGGVLVTKLGGSAVWYGPARNLMALTSSVAVSWTAWSSGAVTESPFCGDRNDNGCDDEWVPSSQVFFTGVKKSAMLVCFTVAGVLGLLSGLAFFEKKSVMDFCFFLEHCALEVRPCSAAGDGPRRMQFSGCGLGSSWSFPADACKSLGRLL